MYRGLIKSPLSLTKLWVPQSTRILKTKIKDELLQSLFHFHCLVAGKQWEKSKKLWFQFVLFYFGFCFEFLIELLKKIKALLFFEIGLCLWVFWNFLITFCFVCVKGLSIVCEASESTTIHCANSSGMRKRYLVLWIAFVWNRNKLTYIVGP